MKVTIAPSEPGNNAKTYPHPTVNIDYPHDDLVAEVALKQCVDALVAWGFAPGYFDDLLEGNLTQPGNKPEEI